ncbi:MAG: carboxypeptidase-like regulatory domain-containing protein, partial [Armatimonadetes bacterium]|nr:carboxypeptidase-like regulatory domain-containing protein [Armatimonadota bacterium]
MALGASLLALCGAVGDARAADTAFVTGVVLSRTGKEPLAGATVAVYDQGGKVIDYAKTDADGSYVLAVPWSTLRLKKAAGGGFVRKVGSGVSKVAGGLSRMASGPLKAGIRAAAAAASADPVLKIGAQAAAGLASKV